MIIGYLHLGASEHGLHRYGHLLAQEASSREKYTVVEASVILGRSWWKNQAMLRQTTKTLAKSDIIHIQFNKAIWGEALCIFYIFIFLSSCSVPVVVTLHDVYWKQVPFKLSKLAVYMKGMYGPNALAYRLLLRRAKKIFVCTEEEKNRLESISGIRHFLQSKLQVIPHFVEARNYDINPIQARQRLGVKSSRIITLLGWIHPKKGHKLLVEAIPKLPSNVLIIFAGRSSPGSEDFLANLLELADTLNVSKQLLVTGYLSEEQLNQYLAVTEVAVCPFMDCSASGSLSTWISALQPNIVATSLPQIQEYNRLELGAIHLFKPYTSKALALEICYVLEGKYSDSAQMEKIKKLKDKLSIEAIFDTHAKQFEECIY
jgi:glycosyltransferase involved in cell wall biosynthesis